MKGILAVLIFGLALAGDVHADFCLSWSNPTQNTDGTDLTDHAGTKIYCNAEVVVVQDPDAESYRWEDSSSGGSWSCQLSAFNEVGAESEKSAAVTFELEGGSLIGSTDCVPDAPVVVPPIPNEPRKLTITRRGYYTMTDPAGELLLKPDGSTRQVTSRDEAYERIIETGVLGTYTIHPPTYEVNWQ